MLTVELHLHCVVKKPLNHYGLLIRESCNRCVENDDDGSEIQTLNVLSLQTQRSHQPRNVVRGFNLRSQRTASRLLVPR